MCWFLLGWRSGAYYFGSLWPWHWILASFLGFSCLEHISYITANFSQMCLMLDQFLWGHLSCYCDISCFFSLGSKSESHADWCKSYLSVFAEVLCFNLTNDSLNLMTLFLYIKSDPPPPPPPPPPNKQKKTPTYLPKFFRHCQVRGNRNTCICNLGLESYF